MKIDNKQVQKIYNRWDNIWRNDKLALETRLKAFSIMRVIEKLTVIYEYNEELDEEDIDDLFIAWGKRITPLLPEEEKTFIERLKTK